MRLRPMIRLKKRIWEHNAVKMFSGRKLNKGGNFHESCIENRKMS